MKRHRDFQRNEEILKIEKDNKMIENHLKLQYDEEMKKLAEEKKKHQSSMNIEETTNKEDK